MFSLITASIDGLVEFISLGDKGDASRIGVLKIDMNSRFIINDGQYRPATIKEAPKTRSDLCDKTVSVVFLSIVRLNVASKYLPT